MTTDEQRMRREFEVWAEGVDLSPDFAAEREKCPDDPTYGWDYGKLKAWEAWQARDAEVQALREALEHIADMYHSFSSSNAFHALGEAKRTARAALASAEGETNAD